MYLLFLFTLNVHIFNLKKMHSSLLLSVFLPCHALALFSLLRDLHAQFTSTPTANNWHFLNIATQLLCVSAPTPYPSFSYSTSPLDSWILLFDVLRLIFFHNSFCTVHFGFFHLAIPSFVNTMYDTHCATGCRHCDAYKCWKSLSLCLPVPFIQAAAPVQKHIINKADAVHQTPLTDQMLLW